nr:hypothetical protein [Bacteroidota bacterium]
MNNEPEKMNCESPMEFDESKEDTYSSMLRDFFGKRMRWVMVGVFVWFFIFLVPLVISVIGFFRAEQVQYQIMYAAIFVCSWLSIGFLKVFAWVMVQRVGIRREIKRLESRLAN